MAVCVKHNVHALVKEVFVAEKHARPSEALATHVPFAMWKRRCLRGAMTGAAPGGAGGLRESPGASARPPAGARTSRQEFSHSPGGQSLKSGCWRVRGPSEAPALQEGQGPSCLCRPLVWPATLGVPWLIDVSLQSLPLSPRGRCFSSHKDASHSGQGPLSP